MPFLVKISTATRSKWVFNLLHQTWMQPWVLMQQRKHAGTANLLKMVVAFIFFSSYSGLPDFLLGLRLYFRGKTFLVLEPRKTCLDCVVWLPLEVGVLLLNIRIRCCQTIL